MNIVSEWWKSAETEEKIIQLLVVFLTVSIALDRTAAVSISTGAVLIYIIRDCIKRKSLAGFYSPMRNWLGLAVFLLAVLAASVFLGDMPSIHIALKYIYWALPFFLVVYFAKRTDVRYAVVAGLILAVAISSADVAYLYLQNAKIAAGRMGAFSANPNHYAMLLTGILPVLFCALADTKLKANIPAALVTTAAILMGLFLLWKTGSRGAMGGFFLGAFFILFLWSYLHKSIKMFLTGGLLCIAVITVFLVAGIQGGTERAGDRLRLRQFQSCYAMWNDHKLLGVGLNNWQTQYSKTYLQTDEIKKDALRRYEEWKAARKKAIEKAAAAKKAAAEKAAKQEAARIAAWQNAAVKHEAGMPIPHNVPAWFFSATGVIGGIGYLFFVCYYFRLLYRRLHDEQDNWVVYAGFWMFTAIHFHGLFDAGITNKGAARLLYLLLGLALSYTQYKKEKDLQEN